MNRHGGYQGDRSGMLDFSVNINPLGMPPHLKYALEDALGDLGRYPEPDGRRHKKRLARRLGVADDWVILGNGGIELIYLYAMAFSGGKAVIVVPTPSPLTFAKKSPTRSSSAIRTTPPASPIRRCTSAR